MLLLSAGTPMFVMGDEFARTQGGHDNPYNIDSEVTWVDWNRLDAWAELHDFVQALVAAAPLAPARGLSLLRRASRRPTPRLESRSLAWSAGGLYVMANAWWEPVSFEFQEPGSMDAGLLDSGFDGRIGDSRGAPFDGRVVSRVDRAKSPFRATTTWFRIPD